MFKCFEGQGAVEVKHPMVSSPASWPLLSTPSFCLLNSSHIPFYYYCYKNIVSRVLKKQNAVVYQGLFPFCFQRTWEHSSTAALMHIEIIIISMPHFQGLGSSFLFFFIFFQEEAGILVALQAVCIRVQLSSYCRVVPSVVFNLCIHVLYNLHVHMHTRTHTHLLYIFCIYIYLYIFYTNAHIHIYYFHYWL